MNTNLAIKNQNRMVLGGKETIDVEFIKKQFFPPTANPKDIEYCLKVAKELNLSPIKREIFFIERKTQVNGQWITKIEPLTSRDGFLTIAHRTGNFAGIKSWTEIKEVPKLINGNWTVGTDLIAIAEVYRKDTGIPTVVEVEYSEYVQLKKDGTPTQFWSKMPKTMLKKVAESQVLRKAFNISGIYGIEEMGVGNADGGELQVDKEAQEALEAQIEENVNQIEEELITLKSLGLDGEVKDNWIKVVGNTYVHKEILKQLGYKYFSKKHIWAKQI